MHVATRIFEAIEQKRSEALGSDDESLVRNRQLVRLAALLHDVGHSPFSHATEDVMPKDSEGRQLRHEDYTCAIIRNYPALRDCIDEEFKELGISAEMVASVIDRPADLGAEGVVLSQIVSSELDADRMDYLTRDSLYTGVSYGRFDIGRLLETITVAKWKEGPWLIAVEGGGVLALEQFLLSRYYMYLQVYLHDGRRFFDYALNQFLRGFLNEGRYPDTNSLKDYLEYDDQVVLEAARKACLAGNPWATSIWERAPWKTLDETDPDANSARVRTWSLAQGRLQNEFSEDEIFFDDPPQGKLYHLTELGPYSLRAAEDEGKFPILVVNEDEEVGIPVELKSGLVQKLSGDIMIMRLYARADKAKEVKARWEAM
jgi:HD superfamily phosphohydrolase